MAKYYYPATFSPDGKFIFVDFPDIPGCCTQGDNKEDALFMAQDALCLMLYSMEEDGKEIPPASDINSIEKPEGGFVSYVSCDTQFYREFYEKKLVNVTVPIEAWLRKAAQKAHINLSRVMRKALKEELGIK